MKSPLLRTLLVSTILTLSACAHAPGAATGEGAASEAARLHAVIREYTEAVKRADPFHAPYFNVEEDLGKFGDYPSPEYIARGKRILEEALLRLAAVHPEKLPPGDQLAYRLFADDIAISLESYAFPSEYLDFNQMGNRLHSYLDDSSETLTQFPFNSVKHYEDFLKRGDGFPAYIDRQIATLRQGVRAGITLNCDVAPLVPNSYRPGLEPVVEKNPFFRPVGFMPKDFPASDRDRLTAGFREFVGQRIIPGFRKFDAFYRREYLPRCRKQYGIGGLPNGKAWYALAIRGSTNLALDPAVIHRTGLDEVARISSELETVKEKLGFRGSLKSFLKSLSKDPRYDFKSRDEMFKAFTDVKERIAPLIPKYFSLIPTSDYKLVESSNPEDAAGSYHSPTENIPYGRFVTNTKNLKSVAIYGVTTLSLHEAVPGHHFQLALQFEAKDRLSEYQRKIYGSTAFAEGWALYAERLGVEMGMFEDPMQRLGNLNDEMLRAVRLVVDTGIHSLGWTRAKTIAYMDDHLATDPKGISNEANRYSVLPGQALGYKIGQLKILELRARAQAALGAKFDIREFHRVVIGDGTLSLPLLESQVDGWIARTRAGS